MNAALEIVGFLLVVLAFGLVSIPLGLGMAGAGLIVIANRPPTNQGSADADPSTLP